MKPFRFLFLALVAVVGLAGSTAGAVDDDRAHLEAELAAARAGSDSLAEAEALRALAVLHANTGDLDSAASYYADLVRAATVVGDRRLQGIGEEGIGAGQAAASRHAEALASFARARALYRQAGEEAGETRALYRIGKSSLLSGELGRAEEAFDAAIELATARGDRRILAEASNLLAATYGRTGQPARALESYQRALDGYRELGDRLQVARALHNLSGEYLNQSRLSEALATAAECASLADELGNVELQASAEHLVGIARMHSGEPRQALEHFAASRQLGERLERFSQAAHVAYSTATAHGYLGEYRTAAELFDTAIGLARQDENRHLEAASLQVLAYAEQQVGRYQEALGHLFTSLELRREMGDRLGEASSHHGLALVFVELKDNLRATALCDRALAIQRQLSYPQVLLDTLQNLAVVLYRQGRYEEAQKALEESAGLLGTSNDPRREAGNDAILGWLLTDLGRPAEAVAKLEGAIEIQRRTDDRTGLARALLGLGRAQLVRGETQAARRALDESLAVSRAIVDWATEADSLERLSRLERAEGRLDRAREHLDAALASLESQRARLPSEDLRGLFFSGYRHYLDSYLELLHRLAGERPGGGFEAEGLALAERFRARALLDLVLAGKVDARQGVDPELRKREEGLARQIADTERKLAYLVAHAATTEELAVVQDRLNELGRQLADLEARFWARSPEYAALRFPRPLDVAEIQTLLDDRTILLEYALGDTESFLWAVTATSLEQFVLPPGEEIETEARRLQAVFEASRGRAGRGAVEGVLDRVSRTLLGPLGQRQGFERVLVVADGALHYLPFGALRGLGTADEALIARAEVVQLPSASVLAGLRRRAREPRAELRIAVIADPVFRLADPRVASTGNGAATSANELQLAMRRAAGLGRLDRLPHSRREAEAIAALAPPASTLLALDFEASKTLVESNGLTGFDIAHFATHGLLNDANPDLSGLVLSLVDRRGRPVDGFLRAGRIFELDLPLDLVVLSACQTALGREVEGEGLVGLTRAFFHAGARRVLVSLWNVSDAATAELMSRFYRSLLEQGLAPAAALRQAQLSMAAEPRWSAPYYWAGFVLQGDWR